MLILDVLHRFTKNLVEEEAFENMRYTNYERVYAIIAWPILLIGTIIAMIKGSRNKQN